MRCLALALAMCAASAAPLAAAPPAAPVDYDMTVQLDPNTRSLHGHARIEVAAGTPLAVALQRRYVIDSFTVDGRPAPAAQMRPQLAVFALGHATGRRRLDISWHGTLDALDTSLNPRQAVVQSTAASGAQGSFLPAADHWYPMVEDVPHSYRVSLQLPAGQRGLVPGELTDERDGPDGYEARFTFTAPGQGIDLMAGPYRVEERFIAGVEGKLRLRTYFHAAIADLAGGYLDAAAGYLALYERRIGAYPFGQFSIVSSPTPTGFGMPSLTYLGIDVLRLPFIRSTSLGHEILHNWWGNGVYPDYGRGNWSEGLTTFMADYAYRESSGEAAARLARLEWLRDFAVLPQSEDQPLAHFVSRAHDSAQVIGYGKAAMLFFMLRDLIGTAAFDAATRDLWRSFRFKTASWDDLRRVFEKASSRPLDAFFNQWVKRPGAPSLRVICARLAAAASGSAFAGSASPAAAAASPGTASPAAAVASAGSASPLALTLAQSPPPWRLRLPLSLEAADGAHPAVVEMAQEQQSFALAAAGATRDIEVDPDFRIFRRLDEREVPPILRRMMVDPRTQVIVASGDAEVRQTAAGLARALMESPRFDDTARPRPGASLVVLGLTAEVAHWLSEHGQAPLPVDLLRKGDAFAWSAPLPANGEIVAVAGRDVEALRLLSRPLPHYGGRSYVIFEHGKQVDSGLLERPPLRWRPGSGDCGRPAEEQTPAAKNAAPKSTS